MPNHGRAGAQPVGPAEISPELAESISGTRGTWRQVEDEFGLASADEASRHIEAAHDPGRALTELRAAGGIIGILRGGDYVYPGFQFDSHSGGVRPVIRALIPLARDNGWSDPDLVTWICSPTSFFPEEDRPVDHLGEPERVLAAARDAFEGAW